MQLELTIDGCDCTCGKLGCWSNQNIPIKPTITPMHDQHPHEIIVYEPGQVQNAVKAIGGHRAPEEYRNRHIAPGTGALEPAMQAESEQNIAAKKAAGQSVGHLQAWTEEEMVLIAMFVPGESILEYALELGRTYWATKNQISKHRGGRV